MSTSPQPAPLPSGTTAAPGLTAEHHAHIAAAKIAIRPIRRAQSVATISAITLAIFAALSLPFAIFGFKAAFIACGLAACTFFEFRGRNGLSRLDPKAPRLLTLNQIGLTLALTIYFTWSAYDVWFGPDPYEAAKAADPEIADLIEPYSDMIRQVTVGIYAVILLVGLMFQGLIIRYYASRKKHLTRFLNETPPWVVQLM